MKYYDTVTHTEAHEESSTTIISTDKRVKDFFKPLPDNYRLVIVNDLPTLEYVPMPTQSEIDAKKAEKKMDKIKNAVQTHLDKKAKSMGYDDIDTIAKYIGYDNPFRVECELLGSWCASVWAYCYQALGDVTGGTRTEPTIEELIAELPLLVLPQ